MLWDSIFGCRWYSNPFMGGIHMFSEYPTSRFIFVVLVGKTCIESITFKKLELDKLLLLIIHTVISFTSNRPFLKANATHLYVLLQRSFRAQPIETRGGKIRGLLVQPVTKSTWLQLWCRCGQHSMHMFFRCTPQMPGKTMGDFTKEVSMLSRPQMKANQLSGGVKIVARCPKSNCHWTFFTEKQKA